MRRFHLNSRKLKKASVSRLVSNATSSISVAKNVPSLKSNTSWRSMKIILKRGHRQSGNVKISRTAMLEDNSRNFFSLLFYILVRCFCSIWRTFCSTLHHFIIWTDLEHLDFALILSRYGWLMRCCVRCDSLSTKREKFRPDLKLPMSSIEATFQRSGQNSRRCYSLHMTSLCMT